MEKKTGIQLIIDERVEQLFKHGRSIESDVQTNKGRQLITGARILIDIRHLNEVAPRIIEEVKPSGWDLGVWRKMCQKPLKERLIIAGALIAAEIDRIQYNETTAREE